jgi:hypothetical protein
MGELGSLQAFGNELIPRERFTSAEFVAFLKRAARATGGD